MWIEITDHMWLEPGYLVKDKQGNIYIVGDLPSQHLYSKKVYDCGCGCCASVFEATHYIPCDTDKILKLLGEV